MDSFCKAASLNILYFYSLHYSDQEETIIDDGSVVDRRRSQEIEDEIPDGEDLNSLVKITSSKMEAEDNFPETLKLA